MIDLQNAQVRIEAVARNVADDKAAAARLRGTLDAYSLSLSEAEQAAADLIKLVELNKQVNILLSSIGEAKQSRVQGQIEELVTHGLRVIYDEPMSFHIVQSVKRNAPVAEFRIKSEIDGVEVLTPVIDARGGGVVATVSFVLRVVVSLLANKKPVFVFDEVFAHVSPDYEQKVSEFLSDLAEQMGIQVIMVTHSNAYDDLATHSYRFHTEQGSTKVTDLKAL